MSETTGGGELLESLDRHFLACPSLSNSQLADHRERGTCPDCSEAARLAREEAGRHQAEPGRYACCGLRICP